MCVCLYVYILSLYKYVYIYIYVHIHRHRCMFTLVLRECHYKHIYADRTSSFKCVFSAFFLPIRGSNVGLPIRFKRTNHHNNKPSESIIIIPSIGFFAGIPNHKQPLENSSWLKIQKNPLWTPCLTVEPVRLPFLMVTSLILRSWSQALWILPAPGGGYSQVERCGWWELPTAGALAQGSRVTLG